MLASHALGPDGPLSEAIEGYEHRPSQLRMAEAVEEVLERDGVLLVEAGTGTGKTLAYLVPALESGRRVVISTGTRTLQDQIMAVDLPLLARVRGEPASAVCMKGLGNYLCRRRFQELLSRPSSDSLARDLARVVRWVEETGTGDRAELDGLAESAPIWSHILSSSETRIGPRCAHYESCFVTGVRRRAEQAQLIVVNHHLFFADLALRGPHGGGFIPDYDAVIFDEAHLIEDVATQFFGVQVSVARIERLIRDVRRVVLEDAAGTALADEVLRRTVAFFGSLSVPSVDGGRHPLPREAWTEGLRASMFALDNALEGLAAYLTRRAEGGEAVAQLARRAGAVRDDVASIADGRETRQVAWVRARQGRGATAIGASPVDVSEVLREEVFYRTRAVVLTSATLSTNGHFKFIKRRLGLDFEARELTLDSPFDFSRQAALYLPPDMPPPRTEAFVDRAHEEVIGLVGITGGGGFVLCTSYRMMRALAERGRADLGRTVLVQGESPKQALLDRFRADRNAVLYATSSFWEGVDVPGDALRLVIIDKLPFDVPTDPVVVARCERLREEGEEPFMRYLVPAAALGLKQGFGRLIRTTRDRGVVAILDSRIVKKGYGKVFLRSLPDAARCSTREEVARFVQNGGLP